MTLFVIGGVSCRKEDSQYSEERTRLGKACAAIGHSIAAGRHTVVVSSPFEGAADVDVLRGVSSAPNADVTTIEFNLVDTPEVRGRLDSLVASLGLKQVVRIPHPPPRSDDRHGLRYAWLLCQLNALESCHVTIALGVDPDGAANMLLQLADGKRKSVLPLPFLGGAAQRAFERRRYELEDNLGLSVRHLQDESSADKVVDLAARAPNFFISYSRARQAEADHVETLLRRRNLPVTRDESDFGAGHSIPTMIRDAIHQCDVFIAMWCKEYACSPWCFDELELALDRHAAGRMRLWILCVEETRMVPTRARELNSWGSPKITDRSIGVTP